MHPLFDQYLEFLYTQRRAPATVKVIRHDLTHFVTWWEDTRRNYPRGNGCWDIVGTRQPESS